MKLTQKQLSKFENEGYLLVRQALDDSDLAPVIHEYETYINRRAHELLAEGKISQLYEAQPFEQRLASISRETPELYPELDIFHLRG